MVNESVLSVSINLPTITPLPGYVLCKQYIPEGIFKSVKEMDGDQFSEVLAISKDVLDDQNVLRECPVKVGQVIIHAQSNKDFEIGFTKYRNVHFTEIHDIWEVKSGQ